ncbi:phage portal protein [Lactococcus ileimucosae]|uniref:Phage portal protein n=1 Tax=Lactococcus ileimucosae TaxID=2941329 RepID=A0ABV4D3M9_9LACT
MSKSGRYDESANYQFRYSSLEELLDNPNDLVAFINEHKNKQRKRLNVLDDYYKAKNTRMSNYSRKNEYEKENIKIFHNFGKVITQFKVGYTTSNPLRLKHVDSDILNLLNEFDKNSDMVRHNSELMLDISKYGRAYELVQDDRVTLLNVFECFVIYDYAVDKEPIAGVRYITYPRQGNRLEETRVTLYTDENIVEYILSGGELIKACSTRHFFDGVPLIEYQNNRSRSGDYEDLLSLIDAYDIAEANTANHLNDLVNAVLVIKGDIRKLKDTDEYKKMYGNKVIFAQNGLDADGKPTEVDAKYIYRTLDVQAIESYKTRLRKDIFSLSNIPDLTDENFSGNTSGESMKYKLFGFQQATASTMSNFKKAAKERYQLFLNAYATRTALENFVKTYQFEFNESTKDLSSLEIVFKPNIPYSVVDEMNMLINSGTPVSTQTKYSLVSFIDDPQAEIERVEEEQQSNEGTTIEAYFDRSGDVVHEEEK